MIGYWHSIEAPSGKVLVVLGAHLGGHELVVEQCRGEPCWHWMVLSRLGHELEAGVAPDAHEAELLAEEAAFHIHPPSVGDWVSRLL
jgi:hypothetical protein